jgi:hypothetical protein
LFQSCHWRAFNLIQQQQQQPQNSPATRQKYEEAKQELQALLSRKKQVDNNLVSNDSSELWNRMCSHGVLILPISQRQIWNILFICLKAPTWKIHSKTATL